jgi:phosphoribosylanthranilate isomerase
MESVDTARSRVARRLDQGGLVKICGLRQPEHAAAAVEAGADLIGFIFAQARRFIPPPHARACIEAARSVNANVVAVGVFVDATVAEIEAAVETAGVDMVQLHGAEPPELVQSLRKPAIKVFRPTPGAPAVEIAAEIARYSSSGQMRGWFLLDGYSADAAGGTGERADWRLAGQISREIPILLGGGLDPENVAAAIEEVQPAGVDVSSGVEVDGVKDVARMRAFVDRARAAFRR